MAELITALVVEDEKHIGRALKLNLEIEGIRAEVCETAKDAAQKLLNHQYSVILLDVELPDMSGFDLCRKLRYAHNFTPVIMLTVRSSAQDKVEGLEAGADDYLPKPFGFAELLARMKSVLRRRDWEKAKNLEVEEGFVPMGNAEIDIRRRMLRVNKKRVELTSLEFDLLQYFFAHAGRPIPREELLEKVWKLRDYPNTRTVDNFVSRLRRHIELDPTNPQFIVSIRGFGYQFESDSQRVTES